MIRIADTVARPHSRRAFLALAGLAAIAAGCGGGGGTTPINNLPPAAGLVDTGTRSVQPGWTAVRNTDIQPQKKWTVLVYMNGANDLETYGVLNMNQLEQVGSTADVNFAVQFKRIDLPGQRYDTSNGDWSDTRRFYIDRDENSGTITSSYLSHRDSVDMGSTDTLQEFIQWGIATFPAERYCLVIWNHGAGWRSRAAHGGPTRGFSYDDAAETHIDTIEMPDAIDFGGGRKWDLLVMDLSLMQMAEVVYQIRDKAQYVLGSEESPPGEGYPYDKVASILATTPTIDGRSLGTQIADATLQKNGAGSNSTQSVIDLSQVAAIAPALNNLGSALQTAKNRTRPGSTETWGPLIADARDTAESYDYPENKDLIDFLNNLGGANGNTKIDDSDVKSAITTLRGALGSAILHSVHGSQHPRSNGLAAFLPTPTRYRTIDIDQANGFGNRYGTLALSGAAPQWQDFLANGPR